MSDKPKLPEMPELPTPDGTVNFGYGDQPAWAAWNMREYAKKYGAACAAAAMERAAVIAAKYPMTERLHPDVPAEEMNHASKMVFHWTAQCIAAAIRSKAVQNTENPPQPESRGG